MKARERELRERAEIERNIYGPVLHHVLINLQFPINYHTKVLCSTVRLAEISWDVISSAS